MKLIKNLSILFVFFLLVSCGSDDDGGTTNDVFTPTITLDASTAITRPAGSDITDLIDFGQGAGIPASDYTVELDVNDRLQLRQPQGLSSDFTLWYSRVDWFEEDPLDPGAFISVDENEVIGVWMNFDFPNTASFVDDPFITPGTGEVFTEFDLFAIDSDETTNIDYKYDIRVVIEQNGSFFGYYFIDPKIRIKSLN